MIPEAKEIFMTRSFLNLFILISLVPFLANCGGRTPAPVMVAQYGDQQKSCEALRFEMSNAQAEIQRLLPKRDKTGKNVALGVAGWFLLVPWFFMDFKNAEATEYEAYRQRYNHLASIAISKDCGAEPKEYPSIEQMKREYEKQKSQNQSGDDKQLNN